MTFIIVAVFVICPCNIILSNGDLLNSYSIKLNKCNFYKRKSYLNSNYCKKTFKFGAIITYLILLIPFYALYSQNYILSPYENIINGDFSQGNRGFFTDYDYSVNDLTLEGNYTITANPFEIYDALAACTDHTPGDDSLMLVVNGFVFQSHIVWGDTIRNLVPNNDYVFTFWAQSVIYKFPAKLEIIINDNVIRNLNLSSNVCRWDSIVYIWNSGTNQNAVIKIIDNEIEASGNDFALDDISFRAICSVKADAGPDLIMCEGQTAQIGRMPPKGVPPFQYSWQPAAGLNNPNIATPTVTASNTTTYYLTVTDSLNCLAYDTVNVTVISYPGNKIITDKPMTICPCDSVRMTAPTGDTYLWSTGATTQSIIAKLPGTYDVTVTNQNLCSVKIDTQLVVLNLELATTIKLDTVSANVGDKVIIPMYVDSPIDTACTLGQFDATISYNKSLLVPTGNTPNGTVNGEQQIININGIARGKRLENFEFIATLGNEECTDIELTYFKWGCEIIKVDTIIGRFCLKNLCDQPSLRLFDDKNVLYLRQARPNPASDFIKLDIGLLEEGGLSIDVYNFLGEKVTELYKNDLKPGQYTLDLNIEDIGAGSYILKMQTPNNTLYRTLQILH